MNQYGISVATLEQFLTRPKGKKTVWGSHALLLSTPAFRFERVEIKKGAQTTLKTGRFETTAWVEEGAVQLGDTALPQHESITIASATSWKLRATAASVLYLFSGPAKGKAQARFSKKFPSSDYRDKYWGSIESVVSKEYAGKRMVVKRGTQASLEFHCNKLEGYYIHSGKLLLRLRAGRGQDRFFTLRKGDVAFMPPGLMHQRGGLEDTVILEISTKDEDSDSYLVEDGKIPMPRLRQMLAPPDPKKKRVSVDIDGCICTATEGDYENAVPFPEAIKTLNRLYDAGYYLILHTSRFMGRADNNASEAYRLGYEFTTNQLNGWGLKYHELVLGKPRADILIDDRALPFTQDWKKIAADLKKRL